MNKKRNGHLIILSTGRTGTKYLSNILSVQFHIDIQHQGQYSRIINILGNLGLCFAFEALSKAVISYIMNITDRMNKSTADPLLSVPHTLIKSSNLEISKLKILHILRDPRDFVTSFMNWRRQKLRRMFLHHCVPLWQPNPWFTGSVNFKTYIKMSKFEHFCWIWAFKNNLFETRWAKSKSNYIRFRMEDLINNNKNCISEFASFLDLSRPKLIEFINKSPTVNRSDNHYFPRWKQWTKEQAMTLDKHCGPLMARYGYGSEPEWQELIKNNN